MTGITYFASDQAGPLIRSARRSGGEVREGRGLGYIRQTALAHYNRRIVGMGIRIVDDKLLVRVAGDATSPT